MKNTYNTSTTVSQYDYTYDAIGRRSDVDWSGTAFTASDTITYAYNDRSELLNADASTNANYLFGYTYDNIGNFSTSATSETGTAVTSAYTTNNVNQYTAVDTSTNNPAYDDDGNMTTMPVLPGGATAWTLEWNAENRLVKATLGTTVMDFVYDYAGRRVEKKITEDGTVTSREFFVYDGWNLIETLDALNSSAITHKFVWGQDLSGTLQGAGGVGGLLSATDSSGTYYSLYDANGNIGQYLDGSGNIVAAYQYSPFGVIISKSGTKQDDFNFRFSTKFLDNSTGLYYYGFRYYSPRFARWISRDPIGERGGINLYAMVGNDAVNNVDKLGEFAITGTTLLIGGLIIGGGIIIHKIVNDPSVQRGLSGIYDAAAGAISGPNIKDEDDTDTIPIPRVEPIPIPIERIKPKPKKGRRNKKKCPDELLEALMLMKDVFCNVPRSCNCNDTCFSSMAKIAAGYACKAIRREIMVKCFNGGDSEHDGQVGDVMKGISKCKSIAAIKCKYF